MPSSRKTSEVSTVNYVVVGYYERYITFSIAYNSPREDGAILGTNKRYVTPK